MPQQDISHLLLKTAFSCMACDGHIDNREISLLKQLGKEVEYFRDVNITKEIDSLVISINENGHNFLKEYFHELKNAVLKEEDELTIVKVAVQAINADEKVEYSEIKIFKIIRSYLKVSNTKILTILPEIEEYLEQDIISEKYIESITENYFEAHSLPQFELVSSLDADDLPSSENDT